MPFAEDLAPFLAEEDFGTVAQYRRCGSSVSVDVEGIFDDAYHEPLQMVEDSAPAFWCALSSLPNVSQNDRLTINDAEYKVVNVRPDGTGFVVLVLENQDD